MNEQPKIGAFVLETLTTGMYTNPLDALREFVQNSADSIRRAEAEGILARRTGLIEITLDARKRSIAIRDNGVGVPLSATYDRLISIGMSDKNIGTDAGFRGIGRLAGIAYCNTLRFRTTNKGEDTLSTVEWDCHRLREVVSPTVRRREELASVVANHSTVKHETCKPQDHFFEVVMEGVTDAGQSFLDEDALEKYLSQVAPVELDAQRFVFAQKINEYVGRNHLSVPTCRIVIRGSGGERQVFKPYKTHYRTARGRGGEYDFDIRDICFCPESTSTETTFWLWYSRTDLLGMIDDERVAGLRLRKNNIALGGPERVAELFAEIAKTNRRFNAYYIGEIHILATETVPNARRDGFEENTEWSRLKQSLKPFVRERCDAIRELSDDRNRPAEKVVSSATSVIDEAKRGILTGFVSADERDGLLKRVVREEERANRSVETPRNKRDAERITPIIDELKKVHTELEQESRFAVRNLRPDLDRKQRKIIAEILQVLFEVLSKEQYDKAQAAILAKYRTGSAAKA